MFQYPLRPSNRPYGDHGFLNKVEMTYGNQDVDPSNQQMSEDGDKSSAAGVQSFKMTYELFGGENQMDADSFKNYDKKTKDNLVSDL